MMSFQPRNVVSQHGEDGILEDVFALLGVDRGTCVEFGAWDGRTYSNTYNLIVNHEWSGVLIEAKTDRFDALREVYRNRPDVVTINRIVGFDSPDLLDEILRTRSLPKDFDLLAIDIDGCDYYVWEAVKFFEPKVVVIEFNPSMSNRTWFLQARDLRVNHGSSLLAINSLALAKGYELIATTTCNAIYVRRDLFFSKLGGGDNSLDKLHSDISYQTHIIQLYDGTLMLVGCDRLIWHDPPVKIEVQQVLPESLRVFPDALVVQSKGD